MGSFAGRASGQRLIEQATIKASSPPLSDNVTFSTQGLDYGNPYVRKIWALEDAFCARQKLSPRDLNQPEVDDGQ